MIFESGMGPGMMQQMGRMQHMGRGGMMGMGPGMMGMNHDSETMAQMGVIHELIANHDRVKRTVTNLPDGIRTVTESDDPRIAEYSSTPTSRPWVNGSVQEAILGLPIESPALHSIFRDKDKISSTYETTEKGMSSSKPRTIRAPLPFSSDTPRK